MFLLALPADMLDVLLLAAACPSHTVVENGINRAWHVHVPLALTNRYLAARFRRTELRRRLTAGVAALRDRFLRAVVRTAIFRPHGMHARTTELLLDGYSIAVRERQIFGNVTLEITARRLADASVLAFLDMSFYHPSASTTLDRLIYTERCVESTDSLLRALCSNARDPLGGNTRHVLFARS